MNHPPAVSRQEWYVARKEFLKKEKAFTRQRDALNAERRRLPMVKIDNEFWLKHHDKYEAAEPIHACCSQQENV